MASARAHRPALKRFDHGEDDRGGEKYCRHLVEPAVPEVRLRIAVVRKVGEQLAAPQVVDDEKCDDPELGVEPAARDAVAEPKPRTEDDGEDRARGHDTPIVLALHYLEPFLARLILRHGVID